MDIIEIFGGEGVERLQIVDMSLEDYIFELDEEFPGDIPVAAWDEHEKMHREACLHSGSEIERLAKIKRCENYQDLLRGIYPKSIFTESIGDYRSYWQ